MVEDDKCLPNNSSYSVLRDHICVVNGVVFQDRFYCIEHEYTCYQHQKESLFISALFNERIHVLLLVRMFTLIPTIFNLIQCSIAI